MTYEEKIAGGYLVGAMWFYASSVLYPAQMWKRFGVPVTLPLVGELPQRLSQVGLGPRFALEHSTPVYLSEPTEHDHLVEEFDHFRSVLRLRPAILDADFRGSITSTWALHRNG